MKKKEHETPHSFLDPQPAPEPKPEPKPIPYDDLRKEKKVKLRFNPHNDLIKRAAPGRKASYKRDKKKQQLVRTGEIVADEKPMALDPDYVPTDPQEIKETLEASIRNFPLLQPKQYQAIEMVMDYISRDQEPNYAHIAKRLKMTSQKVRLWFDLDEKFINALYKIAYKIGLSSVYISLGRIAVKNKKQIDGWRTEVLMRSLGLLNPQAHKSDEGAKKAFVRANEETGEIEILYGEEAERAAERDHKPSTLNP